MKNKVIRNVLRGLFICPVLLIAIPIYYLFNNMTILETFNDIFKDFWEW